MQAMCGEYDRISHMRNGVGVGRSFATLWPEFGTCRHDIVLRDRHSMMLVGLNSGLTIANETAITKEGSRRLRNDSESHTTLISPSTQ